MRVGRRMQRGNEVSPGAATQAAKFRVRLWKHYSLCQAVSIRFRNCWYTSDASEDSIWPRIMRIQWGWKKDAMKQQGITTGCRIQSPPMKIVCGVFWRVRFRNANTIHIRCIRTQVPGEFLLALLTCLEILSHGGLETEIIFESTPLMTSRALE